MLSDVVADLIRHHRNRLGLKRQELAERCAELGASKLTIAAITNIETGRPSGGVRRREISVDELLVLACALHVAPVDLLVPAHLDDDAPYDIAPNVTTTAGTARDWIAGLWFLEEPQGMASFAEHIVTMPKKRAQVVSRRWFTPERQQETNRAAWEYDRNLPERSMADLIAGAAAASSDPATVIKDMVGSLVEVTGEDGLRALKAELEEREESDGRPDQGD